MDVITARHNTISCFLHPDNLAALELMPRHLASFNHVPRALARLRSGKGGIRDWHALVQAGDLHMHSLLSLYGPVVLGSLPAAS
jgi:DNA mismatch repair ATPase MutS